MYLYKSFFQQKLQTLHDEGRYRTFIPLLKKSKEPPFATYNGKEIIVCCGNDYLGMGSNPYVISKACSVANLQGIGSGGTRNIGGSNKSHIELERSVSDLHKKEAALLFNSGYSANESTLFTLGSNMKDLVFFSDEKNHASIIHGIKTSGAKKCIFRHNDLGHLKELLSNHNSSIPKIIVCVSLYSMDGDFAPILEISKIAKEHNALLFLDEVHAVGIYGERGGGLSCGISDHVDIIQGNFAKAYGVVGGYIAASKDIIDFIRSFASGFIFTTSLPPMVADAARESIEILKVDRTLPKKLFEITEFLKNELRKTTLPYIETKSHIVPLLVKDPFLCQKLSKELLEYGFYLQPINYPTVPRGMERFRIALTPFHTEKMVKDLVNTLVNVYAKFAN